VVGVVFDAATAPAVLLGAAVAEAECCCRCSRAGTSVSIDATLLVNVVIHIAIPATIVIAPNMIFRLLLRLCSPTVENTSPLIFYSTAGALISLVLWRPSFRPVSDLSRFELTPIGASSLTVRDTPRTHQLWFRLAGFHQARPSAGAAEQRAIQRARFRLGDDLASRSRRRRKVQLAAQHIQPVAKLCHSAGVLVDDRRLDFILAWPRVPRRPLARSRGRWPVAGRVAFAPPS